MPKRRMNNNQKSRTTDGKKIKARIKFYNNHFKTKDDKIRETFYNFHDYLQESRDNSYKFK